MFEVSYSKLKNDLKQENALEMIVQHVDTARI